jgi:hypothetical protein
VRREIRLFMGVLLYWMVPVGRAFGSFDGSG